MPGKQRSIAAGSLRKRTQLAQLGVVSVRHRMASPETVLMHGACPARLDRTADRLPPATPAHETARPLGRRPS
jgi:hypothetical protein